MVVCRVASASDAWSIYHPTGLSNAGCSACRRLAKRFNFSSDCARTTSDVSLSSCRKFLPRQCSSKRRIDHRSAQPCAVQIQSEFRGEPRSVVFGANGRFANRVSARERTSLWQSPRPTARKRIPTGGDQAACNAMSDRILVSEIMETRLLRSKVFDFSGGRERRETPANTACCVVGSARLEPVSDALWNAKNDISQKLIPNCCKARIPLAPLAGSTRSLQRERNVQKARCLDVGQGVACHSSPSKSAARNQHVSSGSIAYGAHSNRVSSE